MSTKSHELNRLFHRFPFLYTMSIRVSSQSIFMRYKKMKGSKIMRELYVKLYILKYIKKLMIKTQILETMIHKY